MIKALSVPGSENLQSFSRYLWSRNIPHRISEQGSDQVLWVGTEGQIATVRESYQRFIKGELALHPAPTPEPAAADPRSWSLQRVGEQLSANPLVTLLIIASTLISLLNYWSGEQLFLYLRTGSPAYILESGELWRLFTPIFLHFNILHLVFNMLMLWVFGRLLEARGERLLLLRLVLTSAACSNTAQYYMSGSGFGGMSGVVFAIMAYCWLWDRLRPAQRYGFPNALMGFMLAWLALGYTDLLRWVGLGVMANTAHLAGLIFGWVFALLVAALRSRG